MGLIERLRRSLFRHENTCPICRKGKLVKPNQVFNTPIQPDFICDNCGQPFWYTEVK
jgi:transcription elongation factor Elf1